MASASRRGRHSAKLPKMVMQGKVKPERFWYCIEHDTKMKPVLLWDSKTIHYDCPKGCRLSKGKAILK